jgi:leucyl-tRNA synthetase
LVQEFNESRVKSQESRDETVITHDSKLITHVSRAIHPAIKKVTNDIEELKYNTAIATLMKCVNDLYEIKAKDGYSSDGWKAGLEALVMMIGPFAPHTAEELWHDLGHTDTINKDHWPEWEDKYLVSDTMTIAVQVNGKLRGTVEVATDTPKEEIITAALTLEKVKAHLAGEPKKTIYVPNKLVNFVA